jgi:toxin ParE1/3/4
MDSRVIWLRQSVIELNRNIDFVAVESPQNAKKVAAEIYARVAKLKDFPRQGSLYLKRISQREIRQIYVYRWRIIYELNAEEIQILRVIHMSQNLDDIELN